MMEGVGEAAQSGPGKVVDGKPTKDVEAGCT